MVDQKGNESIEIIPQKASMGYLRGYSDPDYIESLETISLPFLKNGKFRAFPASGDSMPPFKDGSFIIGKYMEGINDLKSGTSYILYKMGVTRTPPEKFLKHISILLKFLQKEFRKAHKMYYQKQQ